VLLEPLGCSSLGQIDHIGKSTWCEEKAWEFTTTLLFYGGENQDKRGLLYEFQVKKHTLENTRAHRVFLGLFCFCCLF
jgi:hypothetical protein